jgi:oxygen-independent coproporphyrinogen-3 oxidase
MSLAHLTEAVTTELLLKYDRPGPRYTSYPTANEFHEGFGPAEYEVKLSEAAAREDEPLSLYVHLPFCHERCTFCGCNVIITRRPEVSARYLDLVAREAELIAGRLKNRRSVVQYHFGGGTPTYQSPAELRALHARIGGHFEIAAGAEVAVEVDPRVTTAEHLAVLREIGFNRLSLGVQDVSAEVQEAINRGQSPAQTGGIFSEGRRLGFQSINIDLVYGLPLQTRERFARTLAETIRLRPDRVACYSFAHIPWIRGNQRRIRPEELPEAAEKFRLFGQAIEAFLGAGYDLVGMDHFALPGDEMARAARAGTLHRNFMGYTVMPASDMIGLGVSSIGDLRGAYAQNTKKLSRYEEALAAGVPPVERGIVLTTEDLLRRDVITRLMCNMRLDVGAVSARFGIDFAAHFAEELAALRVPESHGFVKVSPEAIEVVGAGRLFIRNVCMIFDTWLRKRQGGKPVFSRTV